MATSIATRLRIAITAVLNADAGVQSLCGRSSGCVVAWKLLGTAKYPVIAYQLPSDTELDGIDDPRECLALFGAFADGDVAPTTVEALCQRIREALTPMAIYAQGVECNVLNLNEQEIDDGSDVPAGRARRDVNMLLRVEA